MKILVCSDGHAQAENAIRFATEIAAACKSRVALLGIVEQPREERALMEKLQDGAKLLRERQVEVEIIAKHGHPQDEIKKIADETACELVVIGAERKHHTPFCMSAKAYDIVKMLTQPVLIVIGAPKRLERILLCSGGDTTIQKAVDFTVNIASCTRSYVGVVHVMAALPLLYSAFAKDEEDAGKLLGSTSILGRNLRREKESFDTLGIHSDVLLRHGMVAMEILKEVEAGGYDMIVAGASLARGPIGHYLLGDVTREIIDGARCPVLVVRGEQTGGNGAGEMLKRIARWLTAKIVRKKAATVS